MELPKLPQCIEETRTSSAGIELGQVKDASQYPYSDFIFGRMPVKSKIQAGVYAKAGIVRGILYP